MNNEFMVEIEKRIDKAINDNIFYNKFIVIFGANTPGDKVIDYLSKRGIQVNAVIDNNAMNKGKKLSGINIYTPNDLLYKYREDLLVLISSKYYLEMCSQLKGMGYTEEKHILRLFDFSDVKYSIDIMEFENAVRDIYEGEIIYNRIINKYYGIDTVVFLCPVKANGDIYLISSYFKEYIEINNISQYALVVIGTGCLKVTELFNIDNVEVIEQREMEQIVKLHKFLGADIIKIKTLQPYYLYTSILNYLDGYKGINFGDFFKYSLFELDDEVEIAIPKNRGSRESLEEIIENNKLEKARTVIIAPYANSLPGFSLEFWSELSKRLLEHGYKVFTNSVGEREPIIQGTKHVKFSLGNAISVVEYAGCFIGMRSGLCEVISSAICKKIVLYPDKAYAFGKAIDIYGLKNIGISSDTLEIEVDTESVNQIIGKILEYLDMGCD